jgi:hypothetical protein
MLREGIKRVVERVESSRDLTVHGNLLQFRYVKRKVDGTMKYLFGDEEE